MWLEKWSTVYSVLLLFVMYVESPLTVNIANGIGSMVKSNLPSRTARTDV